MLFNRVKESFKSRLSTEDYKAIKVISGLHLLCIGSIPLIFFVIFQAERSGLPITAHREEILNLVKNNQVLIISGETGCGKSTQVPQFLAEHILECLPEGGSVICTQVYICLFFLILIYITNFYLSYIYSLEEFPQFLSHIECPMKWAINQSQQEPPSLWLAIKFA